LRLPKSKSQTNGAPRTTVPQAGELATVSTDARSRVDAIDEQLRVVAALLRNATRAIAQVAP
jgi:hypothetical protein